jgi:hypothetical protein
MVVDRISAARVAVENRLHLVPRFRQALYSPKRGGRWPLWLDDRAFDLSHQVDVAQVPVPGDEAQLPEGRISTTSRSCPRCRQARRCARRSGGARPWAGTDAALPAELHRTRQSLTDPHAFA